MAKEKLLGQRLGHGLFILLNILLQEFGVMYDVRLVVCDDCSAFYFFALEYQWSLT